MKNYYFILLFCILILPVSQALLTEEVEDKWCDSGDSFDVLGKEVKVMFNDNSSVTVYVDDSPLKLYYGDSKEKNGLIIDYDNFRELRFDMESWVFVYDVHLTVSAPVANITVTRNIPKVELLPGETMKITSTLNNKGDATASSVSFEDDFPDELLILDVESPCIEISNKVRWSGKLYKGGSRSCEYTVKAVDTKTYSSKAKIKYDNGISSVTDYSEEVEIKVLDHALDVGVSFSDKSPGLGESIIVNVTLENSNLNHTVSISKFHIILPSGVFVIRKSGVLSNNLSFSTNLDPGQNKSVFAELGVDLSGKKIISIESLYSIKGITDKFVYTQVVDVDSIDLNVIVEGGNNILVSAGESVYFMISYENLDSGYSVYNVNTNIISGLSAEYSDRVVDKLVPMQSAAPVPVKFSPDTPGEYTVVFKTAYESDYGEVFTDSQTVSITVLDSSSGQVTNTGLSAPVSPVEDDSEQNLTEEAPPETVVNEDTVNTNTTILTIVTLVGGSLIIGVFVWFILRMIKKENKIDDIEEELEGIKK